MIQTRVQINKVIDSSSRQKMDNCFFQQIYRKMWIGFLNKRQGFLAEVLF